MKEAEHYLSKNYIWQVPFPELLREIAIHLFTYTESRSMNFENETRRRLKQLNEDGETDP
jgi:hypothetical protein